MKKKIFSLIVLCSLLITLLPAKSYAVDTNENPQNIVLTEEDKTTDENLDSLSNENLIASETVEVPISLSLSEFNEIKPELDEYNTPYSVQGSRAIVRVNVTTNIHYVRQLYFSITAHCSKTLLTKITGSITWKYQTSKGYSKANKIYINYKDSFGIPKYTLTCIKYTGKTFSSGKKIRADFNLNIEATGKVSGGTVSRTVTGTIP